ncbi:hypothetical protein PGT21_024049 [Puccinia graminis f. sp. tritici]|uniref:Uncharacterized protein n=1 Tax=Puccinia graminis f. sp. tritici TaxID=56615 RepID=A0A5B0QBL4_PUCGR|nr:hypothetical protein PGT21_024049 [Puccinia graminis f. sp. tritici]
MTYVNHLPPLVSLGQNKKKALGLLDRILVKRGKTSNADNRKTIYKHESMTHESRKAKGPTPPRPAPPSYKNRRFPPFNRPPSSALPSAFPPVSESLGAPN